MQSLIALVYFFISILEESIDMIKAVQEYQTDPCRETFLSYNSAVINLIYVSLCTISKMLTTV